jgi:stage II sporulation protein AA (anti-sigma F factor antagonist)
MTKVKIETFAVENQPQIKVIKLIGDMDETNFSQFKGEIESVVAESDLQAIILDFQKLTYMNSLVVGYLASTYSSLSKKGKKIVIFGASKNMQDVINMVGLNMIIDCVDTLEDGLVRVGTNAP